MTRGILYIAWLGESGNRHVFERLRKSIHSLRRFCDLPITIRTNAEKEDRDFFPDAHEVFKLKFDGKDYEMKVNHKDDIMTGQLYNVYKFPEGTTINVEKKRTKYVLTAKGTQSW